MVARIEIVLVVLTLLLAVVAGSLSVGARKPAVSQDGESVQRHAARLVEINSSSLIDEIVAREAVRRDDVWYFDDIVFRNPEIRKMSARRGRRGHSKMVLEGNVSMLKEDSSIYRAQKVVYLSDRKIFYSVGPFEARKSGNRARGYDFRYDMKKRSTTGRGVRALYKVSESKAK